MGRILAVDDAEVILAELPKLALEAGARVGIVKPIPCESLRDVIDKPLKPKAA